MEREVAWVTFEVLELPTRKARDCPPLKPNPGVAQGTYHQFQVNLSLLMCHLPFVSFTVLLGHRYT